jgi:hypothetical protein
MSPTNFKLPRGLRNNNPGNIRRADRDNPFQGEVRPSQDTSFRQFKSMAYGYRAMLKILFTYHKRGQRTITQIIKTWAPPVENNTLAYIHTVAKMSGIDQGEILDIDDMEAYCKIVAAMSFVENGVAADMDAVHEGWDLL